MRNRSRGKGLFSIRNLFFAAIAAQVVILSFVATTHWSAPRNEGSSSAGGLLHGARYQAAAGLLENRRAPGSQGQNRGPGEPTTGIELGQMVGDETSVCVWERPGDYDGDVRVATEPAWAKDFLLVGSCGGKKLHVAYVEESAAGWMPSTSAPPPGPPPFPTGTGGGGVRQQQGSSHNSWRYIRGAVRYGTVDHCTKPVVPHRYDVTNEPPAPCATSASHVAASPSQGVYILTLELPISGDSAAMEEGSGVWVTVQRGLSGCVVELEQASSKDENNGCKTVEGELMHSKIGSKVIKHSLGMPTSSTTSEGVGVGGEAAAKNCDTSMYRGYWGLDHEWVRTPPCVHAQPQREYPPEAPVCVLGNGKYLGPTSSTLITRWLSPLTTEVFFPEEPECTVSPEGCRMNATAREDLGSCFDHTTIHGGVIIAPLSSIISSPTPAGALDTVKDISILLAKMNRNPRSKAPTCVLVMAAHDTGGGSHLARRGGESASSLDGGGGGSLGGSSNVWTTAAVNKAAREAASRDPLNIHFVDGFHASEPLRFIGKVNRERFPPSFYMLQIEAIVATVHEKCGLGGAAKVAEQHEEDPNSPSVRERHRREEKRRESYRIFVAP